MLKTNKIAAAFCLAVFLVTGLLIGVSSVTSAERPKPSSDVVYTAPITLYWLAKSGVPEAVDYVKYINAERIVRPEDIPHYERVEKVNKIFQEMRYTSLNEFIVSENYSNVIDLGCGVSPRCLYMADKGINYVGVDLPEVVKVLNIYAPNFIKDDKKQHVRFKNADVANLKEMTDTAKGMDGKVCIVEEGLLNYISRDRQRAMLQNIRTILKKNGGCFVTSDFVADEIFMSVSKTIYGAEDALIIGQETQKLYESFSDTIFSDTLFKTNQEAVSFIEEQGLKVEMRPIFKTTPDLRSIRDLNNRDITGINALTRQRLLWVITVADE